MLHFIIIVLFILWLIQRLWKMRRILLLSIKLRNKYLPLPLIGHGLMFLGTAEDRMKSLQKFGREAIKNKHGMTSVWLGLEYFSMVSDPIIAGVVTKASLDKTDLTELARHLLGNGSIFAPVNIWRARRKVLAPTFSAKNLNGLIEIFAKQSMIMVTSLKSRPGCGTFSIWNNITSYTMDSICETALGVQFNAQTQSCHPFLAAFNEYCKLFSARILQPWLHWDSLYRLLPVFQEAERNKKIIHDFVDAVISEKKIALTKQQNITDLSISTKSYANIRTFLDLLMTRSSGSDGYTDLEIREEILVLVLAGNDTSAVGASFAIVMLSRHLSVQEKAYKEVSEIFGESERPVTRGDLSKLEYIDALVKESLRLYPPVPVIARQNHEDVNLSSEVTLPAGSCTAINIWGINRNPKYWGDDAEEFNPDRFMDENVTHRTAYMTFSYGPRSCLGYQYAIMSIKIMLVTLLRYYKVLPPSDVAPEDLKKPLKLEYNVMMKDADNFKVRLEHRT